MDHDEKPRDAMVVDYGDHIVEIDRNSEAFIDMAAELDESNLTKCPKCGSEAYSDRVKGTVSREAFEALGAEEALLQLPIDALSWFLLCQDCGHEWTEENIRHRILEVGR